jgi:hypothetical protein
MASDRHPDFGDSRAVRWHARLADALAEATGAGRRVLLVHGAKSCGGTRALVEKTLEKDEIAEYVNAHFVLVASRAEAAEPEVAALLPSLPKQAPTPVCVYLDASGRALHSTAGGRPPAVFLNDMQTATAKR